MPADATTPARAWMMVAPGKPVERRDLPVPDPGPGEAVIEVAGCGVCHTDISFLHLGVKTRAELPLALGHEISGTVTAAGEGVDEDLVGRPVLVPAVLPCGECELCRAGERRICRAQVMPGNDRHGGFASHVVVPARFLCPIGDAALAGNELWELAVVADAITTPFQAVRRSGLAQDDVAIVLGVGGIGIHGVQVAAAVGARVVALDVDQGRLDLAASCGAGATVNVSGLSAKEIRSKVSGEVKGLGGSKFGWKIFEMSGTRPGQETGFSLLSFGGTLAIVGFTMDRLEVRLSNLMAFDAAMFGIWGCDPELYPEVLELVGSGKIRVSPFVERHPLDSINEVLDAAHAGKLAKRAVLTP
jgi:6-hydroxycyclohex-1-ene-1-carbonyl-CoA dehydrogenase